MYVSGICHLSEQLSFQITMLGLCWNGQREWRLMETGAVPGFGDHCATRLEQGLCIESNSFVNKNEPGPMKDKLSNSVNAEFEVKAVFGIISHIQFACTSRARQRFTLMLYLCCFGSYFNVFCIFRCSIRQAFSHLFSIWNNLSNALRAMDGAQCYFAMHIPIFSELWHGLRFLQVQRSLFRSAMKVTGWHIP